jgi:sulfite exporter TauE/SafE
MNTKQGAWVIALILAIALGTAINMFTIAILYEAIFRTGSSGVSENATQILTGWGGGIVGIIGAYVGYRVGASQNGSPPTDGVPPNE